MFVSTVARRVAPPTRRALSTTPLRQTNKAFITYAKHVEQHPDVYTANNGNRMYVVSPKESPSYDVPGGAYPTSDPYVMPQTTSAPEVTAYASTAPGTPHPNTTQRLPHNESGVGTSASVRFRSAPGMMASGSDGGLDLMDASTTHGENRLADRNPQPSEEGGKQGLDDAWRHRK